MIMIYYKRRIPLDYLWNYEIIIRNWNQDCDSIESFTTTSKKDYSPTMDFDSVFIYLS